MSYQTTRLDLTFRSTRSKTMISQCIVRGWSSASRTALRTCIQSGSVAHRSPSLRRRDLSVQVQVTDAETERSASEKVTKLADDILELNLLEITDLSNVLKDRLGLDALPMGGMMSMAAVPAAAGAAAEEAAPVEEKTSFDIKLESFNADSKIKVIKEIRTITEMGLKEAKDMVFSISSIETHYLETRSRKLPSSLKKGSKRKKLRNLRNNSKKVRIHFSFHFSNCLFSGWCGCVGMKDCPHGTVLNRDCVIVASL